MRARRGNPTDVELRVASGRDRDRGRGRDEDHGCRRSGLAPVRRIGLPK
jgi:hypothetical protein